MCRQHNGGPKGGLGLGLGVCASSGLLDFSCQPCVSSCLQLASNGVPGLAIAVAAVAAAAAAAAAACCRSLLAAVLPCCLPPPAAGDRGVHGELPVQWGGLQCPDCTSFPGARLRRWFAESGGQGVLRSDCPCAPDRTVSASTITVAGRALGPIMEDPDSAVFLLPFRQGRGTTAKLREPNPGECTAANLLPLWAQVVMPCSASRRGCSALHIGRSITGCRALLPWHIRASPSHSTSLPMLHMQPPLPAPASESSTGTMARGAGAHGLELMDAACACLEFWKWPVMWYACHAVRFHMLQVSCLCPCSCSYM